MTKKKLLCACEAPNNVFTVRIFNVTISSMFFLGQKPAFVCEFQHTPLRKKVFFTMFHTSNEYEILWTPT
jgi:hypothetical protein